MNYSNYYAPVFLNPNVLEDKHSIDSFIQETKKEKVIDEVSQQLDELYCIRNPQKMGQTILEEEFRIFREEITKNNLFNFGIWVYYPWNDHLVHFLPEELHQELRTARNRNLITTEEQEQYYNADIAIAGLSVGNSAAATIVATGGGKYLRLADHDILSGSNLNRIRASFTQVGTKKVDIISQEIYQVNPFAQLRLFSDGVTESTLEEYLLKPKPINLLIEEMDNIYLKIQIRLIARKNKIPVIMATDNGDNVLLDVERFDLEPDRPLFHGDIPEEELLAVTPNIPKPQAARMITRWVHPENVASRMKSSLLELGKSLYSWPQLGNAAFLAGCVLSYTARNILNGHSLNSGKYSISLDTTIRDSYLTSKELQDRNEVSEEFLKVLKL